MKFDVEIPTCREGVMVPAPFARPKEIIKIIQLAEKLGFYAVWGNDFIAPTPFRKIPETETPNWYELLISLAYAAAVTERIMLGAGVIMLPFRDTVILAKQAATLDQFSNGRFLFGVGLGTNREEFEAVRSKERKAHRGRMMDEQLEALCLLLDHNRGEVNFEGEYVEFHGVNLNPKPVQKPFPIFYPGKTPDALSRVARWGRGLMVPASQAGEALNTLYPLLEKWGRDISEIDVTAEAQQRIARTHEAGVKEFFNSRLGLRRKGSDIGKFVADNWIGTPADIAQNISRVKEQGIDHFIALHIAADTVPDMMEQMQMLAEEVMPLVK